ncbi:MULTISPECIES: ABC transporter substrate-binding protein [Corallococcus]|uniref:ABC transporter substrate-binding protein n=1 Tax=Corallococcus TaxID=83461 RepID=UPI001180754B|nr:MULTISPECIES: helical backbone metal receptor [Corallococcus]NBD12020.1 ABC transporter substrate-binding protein [Corallococcus silvisoli]TSC26019.1 ABC transporter substrate-binding protein [Corallococcus sp. Z5C101001]
MSLFRLPSLLCVVLALAAGCQRSAPPASESQARRIISLSPSLTETLFALGAGAEVVGVSDYTTLPEGAPALPRVGTTFTPNFEAIARLKPTLLVDQQVKQAPAEALSALAPLKVLPWLSLPEVVASVKELGRLSGREPQAAALAERLQVTLSRPAPKDAPRVLLVLGDVAGTLSEVWYMKRASLHGAALEAAGGRNAVAEDKLGPPNLSLEGVIALNPDAVLVLINAPALDAEQQARVLTQWKQLTGLRAAREDRVRLVIGPDVQSTGPAILDVVDRLHAALGTLPSAP